MDNKFYIYKMENPGLRRCDELTWYQDPYGVGRGLILRVLPKHVYYVSNIPVAHSVKVDNLVIKLVRKLFNFNQE